MAVVIAVHAKGVIDSQIVTWEIDSDVAYASAKNICRKKVHFRYYCSLVLTVVFLYFFLYLEKVIVALCLLLIFDIKTYRGYYLLPKPDTDHYAC